jgi:hypothetical protein
MLKEWPQSSSVAAFFLLKKAHFILQCPPLLNHLIFISASLSSAAPTYWYRATENPEKSRVLHGSFETIVVVFYVGRKFEDLAR